MPRNEKDTRLDRLNQARPREVYISLADPQAFRQMVDFTKAKQDKNIKHKLVYEGKTLAVLKKEPYRKDESMDFGTEAQFVWSYDSKESDYLTYKEFGEELAKYDSEVIQTIARLVLRYMRVDSRLQDSGESQKNIDTEKSLKELAAIDKVGKFSPLELFAQLLGSAACEVGRGTTGYVHMLATMRRIKHADKDKIQQQLQNEIFPDADKFAGKTKLDGFIDNAYHATAFSGSQNFIRVNSELETGLNNRNKDSVWKDRYKAMLNRDLDYMSTESKRTDNETEDARFDRKVTRHAEVAYRYQSDSQQSEVKETKDEQSKTTQTKSPSVPSQTEVKTSKVQSDSTHTETEIKQQSISSQNSHHAPKAAKQSQTESKQPEEKELKNKQPKITPKKLSVEQKDGPRNFRLGLSRATGGFNAPRTKASPGNTQDAESKENPASQQTNSGTKRNGEELVKDGSKKRRTDASTGESTARMFTNFGVSGKTLNRSMDSSWSDEEKPSDSSEKSVHTQPKEEIKEDKESKNSVESMDDSSNEPSTPRLG